MNKISINRNPRRNFFLLTAFSIIFLCVPVGDSHGKINQTEILVIGAGKILKGNVAAALIIFPDLSMRLYRAQLRRSKIFISWPKIRQVSTTSSLSE